METTNCFRLAHRAMRRSVYAKRYYLSQLKKNEGLPIYFFNWWPCEKFESLWFYKFVDNNGLLGSSSKRFRFCSVFGMREVLSYVPSDVKVFFTGENIHLPQWRKYADSLLDDSSCDLALGFDCFEDERYMRFPLWLTNMFDPILDSQSISRRCEQLRYPNRFDSSRSHFASLIARVDVLGIRKEMYDVLLNVGRIDCPSQVLHNDDTLVTHYNDNKLEYLRNYVFNICPENSNSYGYVTEKVFEAVCAGCIPIYWGSYNNPEPRVLNHDGIVFWDRQNGGKQAVQTVMDLWANPQRLHDFIMQPRLLPTAEEEIEKTLVGLRDRLKELIDNI